MDNVRAMAPVTTTTRRRLNGFGLGDFPIPISTTSPPISGTSTNGGISWNTFLDFFTGRIGQLKIEATQFAEGMVRLMYGLDPNCSMPQPGIPVVAGANPPKFCSSSVAGMIERCKLYEARTTLNYVNQQLVTRSSGTDQSAIYVKRWVDQYGRNDISNLNGVITASAGQCGAAGSVPGVTNCPVGQTYDWVNKRCVIGSGGGEYGGGISESSMGTIGLLAMGAVALVFLLKR